MDPRLLRDFLLQGRLLFVADHACALDEAGVVVVEGESQCGLKMNSLHACFRMAVRSPPDQSDPAQTGRRFFSPKTAIGRLLRMNVTQKDMNILVNSYL